LGSTFGGGGANKSTAHPHCVESKHYQPDRDAPVKRPNGNGRKFSALERCCYDGGVEKKGNATPEEGVPSSVTAPNQGAAPFVEGQAGQIGPSARTRRSDARRGVSEKISVCALNADGTAGSLVTTGWALNMSRSGVRAILEERILAGVEYEVTIGEVGTSQLTRKARVVWVQEEHDGVVVGLEFMTPTTTGEYSAQRIALDPDALKKPPPEEAVERDTEKDVAKQSDDSGRVDSGSGDKDR
jgi:hypothetical protein